MTWPEEIKQWSNFKRFKISILHGALKEASWKLKADIYITTPDTLPWIIQKLKGKKRADWPFDMLAVDESGKFKTYNSGRSKNIQKVVPGFKYRYIANGTPIGNGYLGLMSQMAIVDQGQSLGKTIGQYRQTYFKQIGKPEWQQFALKPKADEAIMKKIRNFCICMRAEDHVNMPKEVILKRYIEVPKKALKVYEELETELFAQIDQGELVAESASSLSTKLHQICGGTIYEDQDPLGEPLPANKRKLITLHKEKLILLDDLIEEFSGKPILIGYKFQHDKKALQAYFGKKIKFFNDYQSKDAKTKLQKDWNANKIPLLAGNPKSVGHGLNLQKGAANIIVFFSIDHDGEDHDQFIRRLRRNGNTSGSVFIIYLLAKGLYDDQVVFPNLANKDKNQKTFFKRLIEYRKNRKKD